MFFSATVAAEPIFYGTSETKTHINDDDAVEGVSTIESAAVLTSSSPPVPPTSIPFQLFTHQNQHNQHHQ